MIFKLVMNTARRTFDVVPVVAFFLLIWSIWGLINNLRMKDTFTIHTMKCRRCGDTLKSRHKTLLDIRCLIHKINCKVI